MLLGDHYELTEDVAYGAHARQRLDVYVPRGLDAAAPVVVFMYGGRWQDGSKDLYHALGDALTRRGAILVVPDYRVYPDVLFPGWVEDAALAVRWATTHAAEIGGDTARVVLAGHSAGAHTVTLLMLDPHYLEDAGVERGRVAGAVSMAGPVATEWTDPDVQTLMGPRAEWPRTYPLSHASPDDPPLLLLHGTDDETVAPANSTRLAAHLRDAGGCARSILYEGVDHIGIVLIAALPWFGRATVADDIARFARDPRAVACGG